VYDAEAPAPDEEEETPGEGEEPVIDRRGVMSILDLLNDAMEEKHYRRQNSTKPAFHQQSGRWYKNIWYAKKTNTF
jgi:hypothetical protein